MTTETKTDAKPEPTEPTRLGRDAYSWRRLRMLASRPSLVRFLDGPLSLDELAEEILQADVYGSAAEHLRPGWHVARALATLSQAGPALEYREGKFHLAEEFREPVELYATIARSTAAVERSDAYDRLAYYAERVAAAGLKPLACEMAGACPEHCGAC